MSITYESPIDIIELIASLRRRPTFTIVKTTFGDRPLVALNATKIVAIEDEPEQDIRFVIMDNGEDYVVEDTMDAILGQMG